MIREDEAQEVAKKGLEEYGLTNNPKIKSILERGFFEKPLFIKYMVDINHSYYLVPVRVNSGVMLIA